jgi:hypothetical protein
MSYLAINGRLVNKGSGEFLVFLLLLILGPPGVASSADMEITPFNSFNQNPFVQIYGIPHETGADIVGQGKLRAGLIQDYTSNYTVDATSSEQAVFDGETYRVAFTARYGVARNGEIGIDIPYVSHGGGFLDSFIVDWHTFFGLPQGGRELVENNQINYSYYRDGEKKARMDYATSGIGDISLTGGYRLYDVRDAEHHDMLALKGAVKLPTGKSSALLGSGSTDVLLQLCGSRNSPGDWGNSGIYGSIGGLYMSESDVIPDQHKPFAGVGTIGVGWGPTPWISFKVQLSGNTPLYRGSSLDEISRNSSVIMFGGALKFPGEYLLDIGVSENIVAATAPDVSFHLGLTREF